MPDMPTIITLCGSTRFRDEFIEVNRNLTLAGNIVISVGLFGHHEELFDMNSRTKIMLDELHKRKIDLADDIFVVNVGGYIGQSTQAEIQYAITHGKRVHFLEPTEG